jgi:hypothetical protein
MYLDKRVPDKRRLASIRAQAIGGGNAAIRAWPDGPETQSELQSLWEALRAYLSKHKRLDQETAVQIQQQGDKQKGAATRFREASSLVRAIQKAVGSLGTTDADKAIGIGLAWLDANTYRVDRQDWPGHFSYDIERKATGGVIVQYTIPKNVMHGTTGNGQFDGDTFSEEQLVILRAMHAGLINWGFTRHHLSEERAANHQIASDTQLVQDTADNGPTRTRGIIKRMFDDGYSDVQIGYKVGLGDSRVKQIRLEMGLKRRRGRKKN